MIKTIKAIWTLFFGLALMGITVGAQSTLLGIRASIEGFSNMEIGFVMSSYFLGFLLGSIRTIKIINRVGHVRTFAALTAMLSITILMHAVIIEPVTWAILRFCSGFSVAGVWLVSESWLNHASDRSNRGKLLSFYMMTVSAGGVLGQFLLTVKSPGSFEIFTIISVIVSVAGIPILLTAVPTPPIVEHSRVSLGYLARRAPTGVFGVLVAGMTLGIAYSMGPVYASQIGFSVNHTVLFLASLILGSMVFQMPLGRFSDIFDRRIITAGAALAAAAIAAFNTTLIDAGANWLVLVLAFVFGGLCMPMYSLFNAMTHDMIDPEKGVGTNGTLLLMNGIGATIGPLLVSWIMDNQGSQGFFWTLAFLCIAMGLFSAVRAIFYPVTPWSEHTECQTQAQSAIGAIMQADHDEAAEPTEDVTE